MFQIVNNEIEVNPKLLYVKEFEDLWQRDKTKAKKHAKRELAYIYFMCDYKSEYQGVGIEKDKTISNDVMKDPYYRPDKIVKAAMDKYLELQKTPSMSYLSAIRAAIDHVMSYYKDFKINSKDDTNQSITSITKLATAMRNFEEHMESLEKWEAKVFNEEEVMVIRGGGNLNVFEDPSSAEWMKKNIR